MSAELVEEHSNNLLKSMKTLAEEIGSLVVPEKHWDKALEVKANLRRLSLEIKQFVTDGKASLKYAISASRSRDVFAWMTGVDGSL